MEEVKQIKKLKNYTYHYKNWHPNNEVKRNIS